jgi:hypothetical protein
MEPFAKVQANRWALPARKMPYPLLSFALVQSQQPSVFSTLFQKSATGKADRHRIEQYFLPSASVEGLTGNDLEQCRQTQKVLVEFWRIGKPLFLM